jgi:hypothetical protein
MRNLTKETRADYYQKYYADNSEAIKKRHREYYIDNIEKKRGQQRKYYYDNHEKERKRKYEDKKNNPEKYKARSHQYKAENKDKTKNNYLVRTYGLSIIQYNDILTKQNNMCAICKTVKCVTGNHFVVDHCHITHNIRGLLCVKCNWLLGQANDSITILTNAITYLKNNEVNNE